jgi:hypothetical protein
VDVFHRKLQLLDDLRLYFVQRREDKKPERTLDSLRNYRPRLLRIDVNLRFRVRRELYALGNFLE